MAEALSLLARWASRGYKFACYMWEGYITATRPQVTHELARICTTLRPRALHNLMIYHAHARRMLESCLLRHWG